MTRALPGSVRVLVLEGTCAGGAAPADELLGLPDLLTVAVVEGRLQSTSLALACDLRIGVEGSTLVFDGLSGTEALVAAVGRPRALEWCLSRRPVPAEEAFEAGFLLTVVPLPELTAVLDGLVTGLLQISRVEAIEVASLLRGAGRRTSSEQWEAEVQARERLAHDMS